MASLPSHTRTRATPRITANDLARYMISTETGKLGIIRRAKESSTPIRSRYSDAREALRAALCDPASERRILNAAQMRFEQQADDESLSGFRNDDASKSIDVITAFRAIRNQLAGHDYVPAPKSQQHLSLAGVNVPVNCDVLVHRTHRGVEEIGAALFRLTLPDEDETERAAERRRDMGAYAATLVHMQVIANLAGNRQPAYPICWSIDVQNREVYAAPRTYAQRTTNLENACRFIAAMWPTV